jgi:hypothetical protein
MKRVRRKSVMSSYRKRGSIGGMTQSNGKKNVVKKKDEQNEESYEKKHQNQDTKNKYLEKER